jgi:hypothetical protein
MTIGKHNIFADGVLRDIFNRRGFWEAKDTDDDLDAEISKKIQKGYPLVNTIFDDKGLRAQRKPSLTIELVLDWADAWHWHTGQWPKRTSGHIPKTAGET